jgi:SAM-dependent methyltransferase
VLRRADQLAEDLDDVLADGRRLMHDRPVTVWRCERCACVFREPNALSVDVEGHYRRDEYPESELARLRDRALADFAGDWSWWRSHAVQPGSRLLEIGSYVGGFLTLARSDGCDAIGVDVGWQVSEFAREQGLDVRTGTFAGDGFEPESFDAVFVLNCIEQLPDPPATLSQIRQVLRRDGLLALRTPCADFVRHAHEPRWRGLARKNTVLGVPFARCWSSAALHRMLTTSGFTPVATAGTMARSDGRRSRGPTIPGFAPRCDHPWIDVVARATKMQDAGSCG